MSVLDILAYPNEQLKQLSETVEQILRKIGKAKVAM